MEITLFMKTVKVNLPYQITIVLVVSAEYSQVKWGFNMSFSLSLCKTGP